MFIPLFSKHKIRNMNEVESHSIMHECNQPDLAEHPELEWAESDLHNSRTVGVMNLQPHGLV